MKKARKIIWLLAIIPLILVGCSKDTLGDEAGNLIPDGGERVISITATMPSDHDTRIALTENSMSVSLSWEVGDVIELCFVQQEIKIKGVASVTRVEADGKRARFSFAVPDNIQTGIFTLYGVYGGNGLSDENPTMIRLPGSPSIGSSLIDMEKETYGIHGSPDGDPFMTRMAAASSAASSLKEVEKRKDVVLYFSEQISLDDPVANVRFAHLGSLVNINLLNIDDDKLTNIKEVRLFSESGNWMHGTSSRGGSYNLLTNEYVGAGVTGKSLSMETDQSKLLNGKTISFWGWLFMPRSTVWPELKLELIKADGSITVTRNTKRAKSIPMEVGKSYIFDVIWDGSHLEFTNPTPEAGKPRYLWVDAAANFPDFANSKENIKKYVAVAKNSGFTDLVVDVRPTTGDVLFKSSHVQEVDYLYAWVSGGHTKINRTATWDYLQVFIDESRRQGVRIHAGVNTFVGGTTISGGTGMLFRDTSKREWATYSNTGDGIKNVMDISNYSAKFLNPANDEVQAFLCNLLTDLAKYDLDGIILDRGRFNDLTADFSPISKSKFEEYLGVTIQNYPEDIVPKGATALPATYPKYMKQWLEFRAKVIHDFMGKARQAVKDENPDIKFGVYVGAWYSSYYTVGVNWASNRYNTGANYSWASGNYKNYGYAHLMDHIILGAYARPNRVYGAGEWTMQGFSSLGYAKIMGDCPIVVSGPDVGNWNTEGVTKEEENQAIVNSVKACMDECDGYFLFDMIHLKLANQWQYAKQGIALAIE